MEKNQFFLACVTYEYDGLVEAGIEYLCTIAGKNGFVANNGEGIIDSVNDLVPFDSEEEAYAILNCDADYQKQGWLWLTSISEDNPSFSIAKLKEAKPGQKLPTDDAEMPIEWQEGKISVDKLNEGFSSWCKPEKGFRADLFYQHKLDDSYYMKLDENLLKEYCKKYNLK